MQSFSAWAEIDLGAIEHNLKVINSIISSKTKIMAVVKADGYGHGAVVISKFLLDKGIDFLGVARIEEAIELREGGISIPILILGYTPFDYMHEVIKYNVVQTLYTKEQARDFAYVCKKVGKRLKCHIKVDTGMGRLGFIAISQNTIDKTVEDIEEIKKMPELDIEGIYTHFAKADSDREYTNLQLRRFLDLLDKLEKRGITFSIKHAANSAALIHFPKAHLDMVRPGIMLYGVYPSQESKKIIKLKQAMTLKAKVAMVKEVGPGFCVSYGSTYTTSSSTRLATVTIGYGDGYPRALSSKGRMLIKGKKVKVVGRVCMDYTVLDVGYLDIKVGDEVVVFGEDGYENLSVEEVAQQCNTIGYEILTGITKRVKRLYKVRS